TACHGRSYLALFDLDFFKRVNDRFGHATGDDVLRAFAAILKANVRSADTVARLGGEEFGVLFDGLSQVEAQEACERVRAQFAAATVTAPDG
ncbi:GGDEF domain-containing protein, partial [Enterococcus faecium]